MINILTKDATLNDAVPGCLLRNGSLRAREQIVADLDALGLVEKIDAHTLKVPRGDRSEQLSNHC